MKFCVAIVVGVFLAPLSLATAQHVRLANLFADHMVLQRDCEVPIWGWAPPATDVTVRFGGRSQSTRTDSQGKWMVRLEPLAANAHGQDLIVESAATPLQLRVADVLVGDVWLCSGQSNMHFRMSRVAQAASEIARASHPSIRFFTVGDKFERQPAADVDGEWKRVERVTAPELSAVAFYFGKHLEQKLNIPIGLLVSSVGGTRIETWMRSETLVETGVSRPLIEKWKDISHDEMDRLATAYCAFQHQRDRVYPQAVKTAKAQGTPPPPEPVRPTLRCHDCPSALHCGMIAPLQPFAIRGAIWYQGESNAGQAAAYEILLPAMIRDWRRVWGQELPFLFVQLAPHKSVHPSFREAQLRIWQATPNTAMVVTTDVGNANDIHPIRKAPVGARLALAARALAYGERVEYCGPVYQNLRIDGHRAIVSFTHVGQGLEARGGPLRGFTIAGTDGNFVPGDAVIEGGAVVVTSSDIAQPVSVRYGWAHVPDVNLWNREGLPAAPFRSDAAPAQR